MSAARSRIRRCGRLRADHGVGGLIDGGLHGGDQQASGGVVEQGFEGGGVGGPAGLLSGGAVQCGDEGLAERGAVGGGLAEPEQAVRFVAWAEFAEEQVLTEPAHGVGVAGTGGFGEPFSGRGGALPLDEVDGEVALGGGVVAVCGQCGGFLFGGELGVVEGEGVGEWDMRFTPPISRIVARRPSWM